MNKIIKFIWKLWSLFNSFVIVHGIMLIILMIGIFYNIFLFVNMQKDTTGITNIAFGIACTLASLSFSCSRSISDSTEDKEKFQFAGEKILHSSILLMSASVIKYSILTINESNKFLFLSIAMGYITPILFFLALITFHGGLSIVNKLLWKRFNRFNEWDDVI